MRRLCTESSCPYSGRSAWQAAGDGHGSRTEGYAERRGATTGAYHRLPAAHPAATRGVTGQKSAEAIIAALAWKARR